MADCGATTDKKEQVGYWKQMSGPQRGIQYLGLTGYLLPLPNELDLCKISLRIGWRRREAVLTSSANVKM